MALVTPKAVGKLLLAKPLKEKRKTDELQRLKYLLSGVRRHCLNDLQRSQHDRAGDHLSSDKVLITRAPCCASAKHALGIAVIPWR